MEMQIQCPDPNRERGTFLSQDVVQIIRRYHPDIDEIYSTSEALEYQCAALKQAEGRTASGFHEVVARKRMDELIRIQLDDLLWK